MLLLPLSLLAAAGTIPADIPEPSGIDHDRVGPGARHLAQQVGTNGRSEQQRAETTRQHAGTLRADLAA